MRKTLTLTAVLVLSLGLLPPGVAQAATGDPLVFQELTPCALFDTRPSQGGTGALAGGESRTFHVVGSTSDFAAQGGTAGGCGIPGFSGTTPQTEMVYLNLVAVDPAAGGNLKVWATDDTEPQGGVVNYQKLTPNLNTSNSIVVGVRQDTEGSDITVKANVSSTHVRGVALGYLTPGEASFWSLEGNAGTDPAVNFLGTTDNTALILRVFNGRALRLEPGTSPNVIGGFSGNSVTAGAVGANIGGGGNTANTNRVTDDYGTVGGGRNNQAGDNAGTTSDRGFATVGGGLNNTASGDASTVGGGCCNTAGGFQATVGGGQSNSASNPQATVGGGLGNAATGNIATVAGGQSNTASGDASTVAGGAFNTASSLFATVAGGAFNTAAAFYSFAAGRRAKANHVGTFVWADFQDADMASSASNQFIARAQGGFFLQSDSTLDTQVGAFINTSTGAFLSNVGVWTNASDAALKTDFTPVDPAGVLDRVADMPITSWSYRAEPGVIHIGPTAQDFHAAFGLGSDEESIGTVDADGVALAAIQGLNEKVEEQDARLAELESRLAAVEGGRPAPTGLPSGAWWGLSAALGLLGLGVGRRWGGRGLRSS